MMGSQQRSVGGMTAGARGRRIYSPAMRARIRNSWATDKKPTIETASTMPLSVQEMSNETLVTVAATGDYQARGEVLKRHIMQVRLWKRRFKATYEPSLRILIFFSIFLQI